MKKPAQKEVPYRNLSPHGWWLASYIMRFEWKADAPVQLNQPCLAWENTILIKARDRELAYQKAINQRKDFSVKWEPYGPTERKRPGRWVFEGLTSLLPIYEKLEDGAEISWRVHSRKRVRTIRSYLKPKRQLETFID